MIKVTWEEDGKAPEVFELSDSLLHSLEQYRLSQTAPAWTANGQRAVLPKDASIRDMVLRIFKECLVDHALSMFPPPELAAAQEQARAAQLAAEEAKRAALMGAFVPAMPVGAE